MEFSAAEVCALINGDLVGDPTTKVNRISPIESATKGSLSFISNPKYEKHLVTTGASIVLVSKHMTIDFEPKCTLIKLEDVYTAFSILLSKLNDLNKISKTGIESPAFVDETATYGTDVYVGAFSYIGSSVVLGNRVKIFPHSYIGDGCKIDDDCIIHPGVKIYSNTQIGKNVIIHAGTVIGSDGFGFAPQSDGSFIKIPQTGNVVIEDNVEIGANTTIDRATIASTVLRKGAKLDNLIQIAHNVEIGENSAIAAQTGISGSTKIGAGCQIGGQVGIVGHISIAEGSKIGAKSGVGKSIKEENETWSGRPAIEHSKSLKIQALSKKLPELFDEIISIKKQIRNLSR